MNGGSQRARVYDEDEDSIESQSTMEENDSIPGLQERNTEDSSSDNEREGVRGYDIDENSDSESNNDNNAQHRYFCSRHAKAIGVPALVCRKDSDNSSDDDSNDSRKHNSYTYNDDLHFVPSNEDDDPINSENDNIIDMVIESATIPAVSARTRTTPSASGIIKAKDDVEAEPIGGTMNHPKAPGMVWISGCNPNGIKTNQLDSHLQHSLDLEIDIQCYSEVNTNFLRTDKRQQFLDRTKRMD
jgi:hypothetical protein